MTIAEKQKHYIGFMNNPRNAYNCAKCPENRNESSWPGTRRPCGQFNCWVVLTCEQKERRQ